jgi:hypothetical protein
LKRSVSLFRRGFLHSARKARTARRWFRAVFKAHAQPAGEGEPEADEVRDALPASWMSCFFILL